VGVPEARLGEKGICGSAPAGPGPHSPNKWGSGVVATRK
jgi:hypothetical protein